MPPHLHRRTPLRQPLPPRRGVLLLPPHHQKTGSRPAKTPQPPHHLPPPAARSQRSLRHPAQYRRSPPAHRRQRYRPAPRRSPPLRPPDRQRRPAQRAQRVQRPTRNPAQRPFLTRPIPNKLPNRGRDHHRPRPRHPSPPRRTRNPGVTPQLRPTTPAAAQSIHPAAANTTTTRPNTRTRRLPTPPQRPVISTPHRTRHLNSPEIRHLDRSGSAVERPPNFAFALAVASP
jgi:hypothetical protein